MTLLTRNDRAAVCLAYECIRSGADVSVAQCALSCGTPDGMAWDVSHMFDRAWRRRYTDEGRVEVARLALYLRAVLRADAGDDGGAWSCVVCGSREYTHALFTGRMSSRCDGCGEYGTLAYSRRIRPLWESAPPTRAR